VFIMALQDRTRGHNGLIAFADCAVVVEPTAVQMADIAIATAESTRVLINTEPAVALLSFSTKGSGKGRMVNKVGEAMEILKARAPELNVDGELQADAAVDAVVGKSKAPGSKVAGHANTLIFPSLESANIGYKLVERLGGAMAIGPFLQGLAKPANDLSRGCSAEDIYNVAVVKALQSGIHSWGFGPVSLPVGVPRTLRSASGRPRLSFPKISLAERPHAAQPLRCGRRFRRARAGKRRRCASGARRGLRHQTAHRDTQLPGHPTAGDPLFAPNG